jgi:hypothetical protein
MLEDAIYIIYIVLASITFLCLICIAEIIILTRTVLLYRFKKSKEVLMDKRRQSECYKDNHRLMVSSL